MQVVVGSYACENNFFHLRTVYTTTGQFQRVYTVTMSKVVMYIIIGVTTTVGAWVPTLFGSSMFDISSIFGSVVGGFVGIYVFWKLRQYGY